MLSMLHEDEAIAESHEQGSAAPSEGAPGGSVTSDDLTPHPLRLSIVIEWANTRLNGQERATGLLQRLGRQWEEILARDYPEALPNEARSFLARLDRRVELFLVSSEALSAAIEDDMRRRLPGSFDVAIHVAGGLEYYPLKNFGASLAGGDILLFVDSDVLPDDGWLAHLLGSLARPDVHVVCGQTYVAPTDLVARAFALGWTYALRDPSGGLFTPDKFYANNLALRADLFRKTQFRPLGRRSRGACSLLREDLGRLGIVVWENRAASVDHPPPSSVGHLVVRALAHGRDQYLSHAEERSVWGLKRSLGIAAERLARGFSRARREWRRVGLRRRDVPAALAVISGYYAVFALGGLLTHASPALMGRHFRV